MLSAKLGEDVSEAEIHEEGFMLEMCSGRASWQIEPAETMAIDLDSVAAKIVEAGWEVKIQTRLCHIFAGEAKLTLFPSGKLLVKCEDKEMAISIGRKHLTEWLT